MSSIPQFAIRTILFAMNSSPASVRAFHYSAELARRYGATLLIADVASADDEELAEYRRVKDNVEEEIRKSSCQPEDAEVSGPHSNVVVKRGGIASLLAVGTAPQRVAKFVHDEIRGYGFGDVLGREELQFGERTERILQFAVDRNIDLIVAGQKHTPGILARVAAHLPGGVAYNLTAQARCAVLTVPDR
jgi:nucleotide-binding universal stress UspA family protein